MAEAVELALQERRHLIVEAGTGTGKTLAYLLPVIRSGKRVIISTGTKTLQEQLFFKDVPFLQQHLGELRVCYMKGRGNYLCRQKLYDLTSQPILNGLEEINQFRIISDWEKTTETGDRAELANLPESSHLWPKLDARTDRCSGSQCQQFDRCFITEMRRRAAESDIIIVNHHLFCADLAIKAAADRAPDAGVLPDAGVVIFDEAHELEDVATDYFGVTVSNLRVDELLRDVENTLRKADIPIADVLQASASVREHSQFFFSLIPPGEGRFAFDNREEFLEENGDEYLGLQNALVHLYTELQGIPKKPDEVHAMSRRVEELRVQLGFILEAQERNTVFWIDRRRDRRGGGRRTMSFSRPRRLPWPTFCATRCSSIWSRLCSPRRRLPWPAASNTSATGWASNTPASSSCNRISTMRARRCCTFRLTCPIPAIPNSWSERHSACGSYWKSRADGRFACSPATR